MARAALLCVRLLTLAALLSVAVAAPAQAADPVNSPGCQAGTTNCVDAVVKEMVRRFNPLAKACDHDAIFSLTYLRTTEEYRRAVEDPNFFGDNAFVNREDAAFASKYFTADTNWRAGNLAGVPPAWRIAFDAADGRQVSAAGNMLLGMNAHIVRDLPITLDELGLGSKADHDKVNTILAQVADPLIAEIARRFDPSINSTDVPGTSLDRDALLQLVFAWREEAWQNATALHAASGLAKQTLLAEIELNSANRALGLAADNAYVLGQSSTERDAYCQTHWNT
jgi:hypothetical protein